MLAAHRAGDLPALLKRANGGVCKCPASGAGAVAFLGELQAAATDASARTDADAADALAACAHGALPRPLPKKARREERRSVAALHRCGYGEGAAGLRSTSWLLVKRPAEGLLAGQWEFPNVLVAEHKENEPDDPGGEVRRQALDAHLASLGVAAGATAERECVAAEVEHVFSHVRHCMHIGVLLHNRSTVVLLRTYSGAQGVKCKVNRSTTST